MMKPEEMLRFIDSYENPVYVIEVSTDTVVYRNDIATKTYDIEENIIEMNQILKNKEEIDHKEAKKLLQTTGYSVYYDIYTITKERDSLFVDLELQYFDEAQTKVYVEIRKKVDKRMEMALYQINQSYRPEVLLNLDENLSMIHCNEPFHQVFESSEELRHSHFKNDLVNGFLPEVREKLTCSILQGLSMSSFFSTKLKVYTAKGEERWYLLELEKRTLDSSGEDKVFGYMTNIEKQVEIEEENSQLKNHLGAMQDLTENILYRVNPKTRVLTHSSPSIIWKEVGNEIGNYAEVFLKEKIIHPEDIETYLRYLEQFYSTTEEVTDCNVRFSLMSEEYQWYAIRGKKLFDKDGNFVEVIGALINIEEKQRIKDDYKQIQEYFTTLQALSDNTYFTVDVKSKTLYNTGLNELELGIPEKMYDFPESLYHMVHSDDMKHFEQFTSEMMSGMSCSLQVRFLKDNGEFNWFEIRSGAIHTSEGNFTHIMGKVMNIHQTKVNEVKSSSTNQYFNALQTMSGESFFIVDIKNRIFRPRGVLAKELGFSVEMHNYPECLEYKVHPEERAERNLFHKNAIAGVAGEMNIRMKTITGEYEWYSVVSEIIRDEMGNVVEYVGKMSNITEQVTLESEYSYVNNYFTALQSLTDDVLIHIDIKSRTLRISDENGKNFGKLPLETPNYVEYFIENNLILPEKEKDYREHSERLLTGEIKDGYEMKLSLDSPDYQWYSISIQYIYDEQGKPTEIFGVLKNIQESKNLHSQYSLLHQYFTSMNQLTDEILCHIEIKTMTYRHSLKSASDMGIPYEIPNYVDYFIEKELIRPEDFDLFREYVSEVLTGERTEYQIQSLVSVGVYEWHNVKSTLIMDEKGEVIEIFATIKNIQHLRRLENRAFFDEMTGALNKATYEEHATRVLGEANPLGDRFAVIFIDLDDFKGINDGLGHVFGDNLLATVGKRLKRLVRGNDLVGRIGGDEFSVVLRDVGDSEMVLKRTNIMLQSLNHEFAFDGKTATIKASVGVAIYPEHGKNYKELIHKADLSVYKSKRDGKNVVNLYHKDLEDSE